MFVRHLLGALERLALSAPVALFNNGEGALAWLRSPRRDPLLALVDLGLPDIPGVEVIRALRQRFEPLPILVVSAFSDEESVLEAIQAGARGYLLKSQSEQTLVSGVAGVLAGNYPISPALARYLFKRVSAPQGMEKHTARRLSPREVETLRQIGQGASYREVARAMGISVSTVQANIRSLYRKLEVRSRAQAINRARADGIL